MGESQDPLLLAPHCARLMMRGCGTPSTVAAVVKAAGAMSGAVPGSIVDSDRSRGWAPVEEITRTAAASALPTHCGSVPGMPSPSDGSTCSSVQALQVPSERHRASTRLPASSRPPVHVTPSIAKGSSSRGSSSATTAASVIGAWSCPSSSECSSGAARVSGASPASGSAAASASGSASTSGSSSCTDGSTTGTSTSRTSASVPAASATVETVGAVDVAPSTRPDPSSAKTDRGTRPRETVRPRVMTTGSDRVEDETRGRCRTGSPRSIRHDFRPSNHMSHRRTPV